MNQSEFEALIADVTIIRHDAVQQEVSTYPASARTDCRRSLSDSRVRLINCDVIVNKNHAVVSA